MGHRPDIHAVGVDVTVTDQVVAPEGSTGNVDILVNCAGVVHHGSILDHPVPPQ